MVAPIQIGEGVEVAGVPRLHSQNPPEITQRPRGLAIDGIVFCLVDRPDGLVLQMVPDGGVGESSLGGELLTAMLDQQLAKEIAVKRERGIEEELCKHAIRRLAAKTSIQSEETR